MKFFQAVVWLGFGAFSSQLLIHVAGANLGFAAEESVRSWNPEKPTRALACAAFFAVLVADAPESEKPWTIGTGVTSPHTACRNIIPPLFSIQTFRIAKASSSTGWMRSWCSTRWARQSYGRSSKSSCGGCSNEFSTVKLPLRILARGGSRGSNGEAKGSRLDGLVIGLEVCCR